jgi:hypothetical protein
MNNSLMAGYKTLFKRAPMVSRQSLLRLKNFSIKLTSLVKSFLTGRQIRRILSLNMYHQESNLSKMILRCFSMMNFTISLRVRLSESSDLLSCKEKIAQVFYLQVLLL